jgi:hypothetical protein
VDESGIVLSPPKKTAVVDLRNAFQAVRWLRRRAVARVSVSVVDEHPAMQLFDRPRARAMPGVYLAPVGLTDDAPVPSDLPPVKRTLDVVVLYFPVGQVGAEVGAIGIDCPHLPRGIAKYHPLIARALHERGAVVKVDRPTDDVPTLGVRRRIGSLPRRFDDGIPNLLASSPRKCP